MRLKRTTNILIKFIRKFIVEMPFVFSWNYLYFVTVVFENTEDVVNVPYPYT